MYNNDIEVQFKGFKPSKEDCSELCTMTSNLQLEAPDQSFLDATFSKVEDSFKGIIHIHTSVGNFFATAQDRYLSNVRKKLTDGLHVQLERWKVKRFADNSKV